MSTLYYESELYHHGILGMKWGVRRYQNEDGSLTDAGRRRYGVDIKKAERNFKTAQQKYRSSSYEDSERALVKLQRAKEDLKNERIKEKLNSEKKVSKHRLKLEEHYRQKGMSEEEAAIAAYKRARAEKIFAVTLGVAAATAIAYGAYKYHDFSVDKVIDPNTTLARVTTDSAEPVHEAFYAVRDSSASDKRKYVGLYGKHLAQNDYVYQKKMQFNKGIKVASEKNAIGTLKELVNSDKDYAKKLSEQIDHWELYAGTPKQAAVLRKAKSALKKGKVDKNVYEAANFMLADHDHETTHKLYDALKKKGYGAIKDINDNKLSGYDAKEPLIVFGQAANVHSETFRKLGDEEINKAYTKEYARIIGKAVATELLPQLAIPVGGYAAGTAASKVIRSKSNDKLVQNYKKEHPNTKMSYSEIVRMYEDQTLKRNK